MRAVVIDQPGPDLAAAVSVRSVPDPEPAPGQVLIEVTAAALCRTDLQIAMADLPAHLSPVIPGHQVVGRIVGGGPDRIGQRVGLCWLASACGTCGFCRTGRENLCDQAQFTGYDVDGGCAELVVADERYAVPLPEGGSTDADLAPLLCGGVIGYRSLRRAGISPASAGAKLGLFGFGASASLAIQVAVHWGVHCYVVTRSAAEADRAVGLGAAWAGTYDRAVPVALDAAVTFAPAGWVVVRALRDLGKGGILAINAIHLDPVGPIDYDDLWWEREIRSVANVTRADVSEFLAVVGPAGVATAYETLPLQDAAAGMQRMLAGDVTGTFVLIPSAV
jgi:propanol-preferring alcohol dehydrogenase